MWKSMPLSCGKPCCFSVEKFPERIHGLSTEKCGKKKRKKENKINLFFSFPQFPPSLLLHLLPIFFLSLLKKTQYLGKEKFVL